MSPPTDIEVTIACLAGARLADDDAVRAWYCATARAALERAAECVRVMRLNVDAVEKELARRSPPQAKLALEPGGEKRG